jgi:glycosyltransferase involved in cell wall biosynthesis
VNTLSQPPFVSLIVCTRNRASRLPEFFSRLARLESPAGRWELILVDNASSDSTPLMVQTFAQSATFPVRYVRAPVPGLARARNVGIAASIGDLLVFTDDDCYPHPDYLCRVVEVFQDHHPGFIGGRVVLHDPTDAPVTVRDNPTPRQLAPRTFVRPGIIHGANMAVSREVVRAIGGFDPHLGAGTPCVAGEDADYLARAAWAGWSGRYDPRPVVAHHHGRKPGLDAVRQSRGYDYGRGAYYIKFALNRSSGPTYVSHWCRGTWRDLKAKRIGRPWREAMGAARYIATWLSREPVPRFDTDEGRASTPSACGSGT